MSKIQLSTFFIDKYYFGIEVFHVQEVISYQKMTKVPLSHNFITGLINLRGQIVTAIDLRKRLGFDARSESQLPINVVIHTEDNLVSLLVDEISDVIEVSPDDMVQPPENLQGETKSLIQGVFKLKNKLLISLDTKKITEFQQH